MGNKWLPNPFLDSFSNVLRSHKVKKALDELEGNKKITKTEMIKAVEDAFDAKPDDLVRNKILDVPMASLRDSIIAIKLLPEEHHRPIEDLTNYLRDLEVIMKFVANKYFPGDGKSLARLR